VAVLRTVGHRAITNTVHTAAISDAPRANARIGNQASGDTGRSTCTRGFRALQARLLVPISRPRGTPTSVASAQPLKTRRSVAQTSTPTPLSSGPLS
jgi:hypothetical protein